MSLPFIEPVALDVPGLPPTLEGFRVLHLSDLHVRGPRRRHEAILSAVAGAEYDLLAFTGDLMTEAGDEPAAAEFAGRLLAAARPRIGSVGVWGNHDTRALRPHLAHLPIRWLDNAAWLPPGLPLSLLGVDCIKGEHNRPRGDLAAALLQEAAMRPDAGPRCRILLAHIPAWLPPAAAAGIDLVLSGHTHAGQCRLPTGHILYNATPRWPCRYSCGLLQLGTTQCLISRGLGEVYIPGLRLFSKPQMPLVTLRRAEPGTQPTDQIVQICKW